MRSSSGRILLGDNTSGEAVMLPDDQVSVWWSLDLKWIPYTYVYSIPTCAKFELRRIFRNVTTAYAVKSLYVGYVPR